MALIDIQRRIVEAGRIRIGHQVATSGGRRRPAKLDTFRLTSSDKRRIDQAAATYGGTPAEWQSPAGPQWEVVTERSELEVLVPPADLSFSQHYELWSAGGCQRRCDGAVETFSGSACLCDPDARECDIHTRLSVLLRDLPGLGVWRIDTQGWYAAQELAGSVHLIGLMAGTGLLPARLRLDQRSVKRPGNDGKPETRRFAVPVLDVEVSPALLLSSAPDRPQLESAPLTPVPALPEGSGPTIAEQSKPREAKPRRKGSGPELPASGRRRAPAAEEPPPEDPPAEPAAEEAKPKSRGRRCTHPADRREEKDVGTVCGKCGELLEAAAEVVDESPAEEEKPKGRRAAKATEDNYWQSRVHAVAGERGIDHDGLRLVAGALRKIPADELSSFSMADLPDSTLEALDKLLRNFPAGQLDVDEATDWVEKIAKAKGLADWDAIDPIAAAAISGDLEEATAAQWLAFGLRLHAGEYDGGET